MGLLLVVACLFPGQATRVQAQSPSEYEVKAVFLFNFAKFVEWPKGTEMLCLGILGDDPFGDAFAPIDGQEVGDRQLKVKKAARFEELENCHILFVCPSEEERLDQVLQHFAGRDVLLVGDMEGFVEKGGMINFVRHQSKIRFEVNMDAVERTRLKLSSRLLKLARIVRYGNSQAIFDR